MNNTIKSLNTPTSLSKVTAATLFIVLPFLGFYIGMEYGRVMGRQDAYQAPKTFMKAEAEDMSTTPEPSGAAKKVTPSVAPKTSPSAMMKK